MSWAIVIQEDTKSLRHRRWAFPGPQGAGSWGRLPWVGKFGLDTQIHLASKGQSPQDLPHLNVLARVALGRRTLDWWTVRLPDPSAGSHASECVLLLEFLFREVERRKEKLELCWITVSFTFFWKDKTVNRVIWNTIWQSFIFDILEAICPTHLSFDCWTSVYKRGNGSGRRESRSPLPSLEEGEDFSLHVLLALVSGHNTSMVSSLLYPEVVLSISWALGLAMERASSGKESCQELLLLLSSGLNRWGQGLDYFFHFSSQVCFLVPQDIRTEGYRIIVYTFFCISSKTLWVKPSEFVNVVCVQVLRKTGFLGSFVLIILWLLLSLDMFMPFLFISDFL